MFGQTVLGKLQLTTEFEPVGRAASYSKLVRVHTDDARLTFGGSRAARCFPEGNFFERWMAALVIPVWNGIQIGRSVTKWKCGQEGSHT